MAETTGTRTEAVQAMPNARGRLRDSLLLTGAPFVIFFGMLVWSVAQTADGVGNPDTWFHLRLGEELRGGASPADPGGLTPFATQDWVATQWLPQVVASALHDRVGLVGVAWLAGLTVAGLAVALFVTCRRRGDVLATSVAVAAALFGSAESFSARPQVITFLLLALAMGAWLRTEEDLRPRWWLVPVSWVWACSHGMWFAGVALGVVAVLGLLLDRRLSLRRAGVLAAVPVLSVVAAGLTPAGPELLLAPFAVGDISSLMSEWQPPDFRQPVQMMTAAMVAATITAWSRSKGPVSWFRVLLLLLAVGWVALSVRTVAVGAVMVAPLFAAAIQDAIPERRKEATPVRETVVVAVIGLCLAGLTLLVAAPPAAERADDRYGDVGSALADLPDGTVVYNDMELGGWLEWKHRNVVPVVDGLAESYGSDYLRDIASVQWLEPGWPELVEESGAEYALLSADTGLGWQLEAWQRWRIVESDDGVVLLRRPAGPER